MNTQQPTGKGFRIFLILLYLVTALMIIYFFIDGFQYYTAPLQARAHHPQYQNLKPGGFRGHGLGILGTAMMILLLSYSLRKRTRIFGNWGTMNRWLNIHIYFGIMGPLFVVLHSTFKLNGLVSVSFWSMILVALSGVLGRYLYVQIPRSVSGMEMTRDQATRLTERLMARLKTEFHLEEQEVIELEQIMGVNFKNTSLMSMLFMFLFSDIFLFFKKKSVHSAIANRFHLPLRKIQQITKLTVEKAKMDRRIYFWNQIHRIFHYWHVFHKPFAIVMYLIMLIHVGIAVWLGYTWL